MVNEAIRQLVEYGLAKELIHPADAIYARNQILLVMQLNEYADGRVVPSRKLHEILEVLTEDSVRRGVGPHGGRVGAVVQELGGEKIDIVVWSEDPCEYVRAALSPADVVSVSLIPGQKACRVIVPDDQLSLAIGKEGQNARLAARLTGYKIDIKPASQAEPAEETGEM